MKSVNEVDTGRRLVSKALTRNLDIPKNKLKRNQCQESFFILKILSLLCLQRAASGRKSSLDHSARSADISHSKEAAA